MKAAKRCRQRKRRAKQREKKRRKEEESYDRHFAHAMKIAVSKGIPHCEWNGTDFVPTRPKPPPRVDVAISMMHGAHHKLGIRWRGSRRGAYRRHAKSAVADSGCQTCSAGLDVLEEIGCPLEYLIPTSHRIVGITDSLLDIAGSVFLRIEVAGRTTRQMVHVSTNTSGLYLSERALEELGIISNKFPLPSASEGQSPENVDTSQCNSSTSCADESDTPCVSRTNTPDRPAEIPFAPTKENVPLLEKWFRETFASSGFNTCPHQPLQSMAGQPMDIVFKEDGVKPHYVYTPIPVPHHFKKQVKLDLDSVRLGIIEKVPQGDMSRWCARMVVTPKANGKPRRTVDLQQLNKATIREVHHTPSPINLVSSIPTGKVKTVMDAWNGFHGLGITFESRSATTFITEWGRYRYLRGPQGYHGTSDAYTRRFDDITAGEPRYVRCIDDGLLWDDDIESSFWHTFDHIKRCADNGIVFNPEKFRFGRETVEFAGFEVTNDGYRPAPHLLSSI